MIMGVALTVMTNLTGSWVPAIVGLTLAAAVVLFLTMWIARNHGRRFVDTFLASVDTMRRRS